ncbi:MAG: sigma-70 family RNA polymerase sigma factor [Clostridia bacterium]|nr:sigma-70 family RNA polymerase sigma factor [Clostridia bacterium]
MLNFSSTLIDTTEEKDKFEKLYHLYKKRMWYVAFQILNDPQKAEDAVQNAFIGIAKNISHIDNPDSKAAFAYVITAAKHCALNISAKDKAENLIEFETINFLDSKQEKEITDIDDKMLIISVLKKIPGAYRDLLYLYYYEDMSEKEIALLTGKRYTTVRKQISRARKAFSETLKKEGDIYEKI